MRSALPCDKSDAPSAPENPSFMGIATEYLGLGVTIRDTDDSAKEVFFTATFNVLGSDSD
jgi:hypothetical protein